MFSELIHGSFKGSHDLTLKNIFKILPIYIYSRWATHGAPSDVNCHPQRSGENNEFVGKTWKIELRYGHYEKYQISLWNWIKLHGRHVDNSK